MRNGLMLNILLPAVSLSHYVIAKKVGSQVASLALCTRRFSDLNPAHEAQWDCSIGGLL